MTSGISVKETYALPLGYKVTFTFDGSLHVAWNKWPMFSNNKAKRKFLKAYLKRRNQFLELVSTQLEGGIAVLDIGHNWSVTSIDQPVRH